MCDSGPSLAQLAMRLRALTGAPAGACKDFLQGLQEDQRQAYVEHMEANKLNLFVDPVELDRSVRTKLDALAREAHYRHEQGEFGKDRGSAARMVNWIRSEMRLRHGIRWKSAREMNPSSTFDGLA